MIKTLVIFGAGYVLGTKAGRERYAQISAVAQKAASALEERSAQSRSAAR